LDIGPIGRKLCNAVVLVGIAVDASQSDFVQHNCSPSLSDDRKNLERKPVHATGFGTPHKQRPEAQ
jgi:hypothetical protein